MENGIICPRGASLYIWKENDTLQSVARQFSTTEQAIRLTNEGRDLSGLEVGDMICIPPAPLTCVSGDLYTVKRGDTFTGIAEAYGISVLELSERNPYVDPSDLMIGQVLCVPRPASPSPEVPQFPTPQLPGPEIPQFPTPQLPGTGTPSRPSQCPTGYVSRTVRYGETISTILIRYNISYQAFVSANPSLNPRRLLPGQVYCAPVIAARGECRTVGASRYVMGAGESLESVAEKFLLSEDTLLRMNPALPPSSFVPGQVVCV